MSLNFFVPVTCFLKHADLIFLSDVINHKSYTRNSIFSIGKENLYVENKIKSIYTWNSVCIDEINLPYMYIRLIFNIYQWLVEQNLDFIKRVNNVAIFSMVASFSLTCIIELMNNLKKCILRKFKLIHMKFSVNIFVDLWILFHFKQGGSDAIVEV